jgi:hypothetical protein
VAPPLGSAGVSGPLAALEDQIKDHIRTSVDRFTRTYRDPAGECWVIKYLPPSRLESFLATKLLYASDVPGYTWGDGVYVAPLSAPFSTMMYGRIGIVGHINPSQVFDAGDRLGRSLYQQWIRYQWRWYEILTTTVHANVANRHLRNRFREKFRLDCVFFRPDQSCPGYVGPQTDTWFAMTHWTGRKVGAGLSSCVVDPRWCVVTAEDFVGIRNDMAFDAVIGPAQRGGRLSRSYVRKLSPKLAAQILSVYRGVGTAPPYPVLLVKF